LFDEIVSCGLEALEANNTNCMVQCIGKYRKWNSATDSPFTRGVMFISHALIADGASANGCLKRYEFARKRVPDPNQFNSVIEVWEQCHCVHLSSAEQSLAFSPFRLFCDIAIVAPLVAIAKPAPKPKARGKAKPKAVPKAKSVAQPKRTIDFVSSMVRGANLLSNARTWVQVLEAVPRFVDAKLELVSRDPTEDERAYGQRNKLLLDSTILFGTQKEARPETEALIEDLVGLIGYAPWCGEGQSMMYFLNGAESLMDDVHLSEHRRFLVARISATIKSLFFKTQLSQVNASRWTGVAKGAIWHAAVTLFFDMLRWILGNVLGWTGAISRAAINEDDPDCQRYFLGSRRNLYVHFLKEGHCPLVSLSLILCNAPIRQVLAFLFANSYETKGSLSPLGEEKVHKLYERYLLDPLHVRVGQAAHHDDTQVRGRNIYTSTEDIQS
jgi:hypothetical protein